LLAATVATLLSASATVGILLLLTRRVLTALLTTALTLIVTLLAALTTLLATLVLIVVLIHVVSPRGFLPGFWKTVLHPRRSEGSTQCKIFAPALSDALSRTICARLC
jgi:hypothetical protein